MNKVVLVGRLTRNPETRYSQGDNPTAIARYTLAVDRRFRREGQPEADFIRCVAFGRSGEFADRYFTQGMRVAVSGRIQTGSYTNRDGVKVYTTEVVVEDQEFAQSKSENNSAPVPQAPAEGGQSYGGQGGYQGSQNYGAPQGGQNYGAPQGGQAPAAEDPGDGFMNIPEGIDEELPFN